MSFWSKFLHLRQADSKSELRRHERYRCNAPSTLTVAETGAEFHGEINQISLGGCRFRPASRYLLRRVSEVITLEVNDLRINGVIAGTTERGYRIQFSKDLSEEMMSSILAMSVALAQSRAA